MRSSLKKNLICVITIVNRETFGRTTVSKISTMKNCLASSQLPLLAVLTNSCEWAWCSVSTQPTCPWGILPLPSRQTYHCCIEGSSYFNSTEWFEPALGSVNKIQHAVRIKAFPALPLISLCLHDSLNATGVCQCPAERNATLGTWALLCALLSAKNSRADCKEIGDYTILFLPPSG